MSERDIRQYRIAIAQSDIDDLNRRLAATRWPDELPDVGWSYGTPLGYTRELSAYWRDEYDWRRQEAYLNSFPQFVATIDGATVHFVHIRSGVLGALPLLLTHGWPGSFIEFLGLVGPLTDPKSHGGDAADAFDVIIPSIPGFAFSGPTLDTGWNAKRVATAWAELMSRLGYDRYVAHAGDWGQAITRELSLIDSQRLLAMHVTQLLSASPSADEADFNNPAEKRSVEAQQRYMHELSGYGYIQSTRPQTLAYGLTDSPVGQLAWIVEKFKEWTDSTDRPEDAVDRDTLLTNVSIYWFTGTANSSARIYYEEARLGSWGAIPPPSEVPTAVAIFPKDISQPVRRFAERANNIVQWSEFEHGGHFAALEAPEALVADLRPFFRQFR